MLAINKQRGLALSNSKGFTLIELLVVIVVISILVALTLPNLFAAQERARDTQRKNDLKNLQQQLEAHYNDSNVYPIDLAELETDGYFATGELPDDDPNSGGTYTYTPAPTGCDNTPTGGNCATYTLAATLENANDPEGPTYTLNSVNQ